MTKKITLDQLNKEQLIDEVLQLQHQVLLLEKMVFGPKSERFIADADKAANQLSLGISVEALAEVELSKTPVKEHNRVKVKLEAKPHPGRHALPEGLRREEIIIEPAEDVSDCVLMDEEITEVLEVKAAEFYVKRYRRRKYVRKEPEQVLLGELPKRAIDKGIPGASVLAMLLVGKYQDHLPVYRQLAIFKRAGVSLHYNTVLDWCNQAADVLSPLYELQKRQVLSSTYLQADETGIKVLDSEKKGSSHQGYLWAYRDVLNNRILFEYQPGRSKIGPGRLLKDFQGHLQTDGYIAYDQFTDQQGIKRLCCMAHARRYFQEAEENDKARATYALIKIQELYQLERQIKVSPVEERLRVREDHAVPILEDLQAWMIAEYPKVPPKSAIAKALSYSMKRWEQLKVYTTDGRLEIDNNKIENEIRPIALGRKNFLFAGSHESAQRIAMVYSLLATCKAYAVDPIKWLTHVMEELPNRTVNNIADLLPQKSSDM